MTISRRFRNSIIQIKTHPGAGCGSDHVPVVAGIKLKLKKLKSRKREPEAQLSCLRNDTKRELNSVVVETKYAVLEDEATVEEQLCKFSESLVGSASEVVPKVERTKRHEWMTEEILRKTERRKKGR